MDLWRRTGTVSQIVNNKVTLQLDQICAVGLVDFARLNEEARGVADTFPHIRLGRERG
jgi:hypothetical protein